MLFFRYYLWIAPNFLLALFLILFVHRRFYKQLPALLFYVTIQLTLFLVSLTFSFISPFPMTAYQWVVLVFGGGLLSLAEIWVIYELWEKLVFSRSSLASVGHWLLSCSLALLLLTAAAISGTLRSTSLHRVGNLFEILDFSTSLVLTGLLVVLFVFSRALRISWRSWMVGIALGFGVEACFALSSAAWRAAYGRRALISVDVAQGIGFHTSVLIWLIYLLLPERPSPPPGSNLRKEDLEAWSEQLQNIVE